MEVSVAAFHLGEQSTTAGLGLLNDKPVKLSAKPGSWNVLPPSKSASQVAEPWQIPRTLSYQGQKIDLLSIGSSTHSCRGTRM